MKPELRFLVAIVLMIGVFVITNLLFPPAPPETPPASEETGLAAEGGDSARGETREAGEPSLPDEPAPGETPDFDEAAPVEESLVVVESSFYRLTFSTRGARLVSARLLDFESFTRDGAVELIYEEGAALGMRLFQGPDTADLRSLTFTPSRPGTLRLSDESGPRTLTFTYQHPERPSSVEIEYTFQPDTYLIEVRGRVNGLGRGSLITDLGSGIPLNEHRPQDELRVLAYVGNHLREGISAHNIHGAQEAALYDGPFVWGAFKSKYFVFAFLAGAEEEGEEYFGGLVARALPGEGRVAVTVTETISGEGRFGHRIYLGPQDHARLSAVGSDLEDVNPYGWSFIRPVVRPLVAVILPVLIFLHENLHLAYGWVLILIGIMMRVLLFPLNQRAMRAQIRNMAVQPLIKEIQTKYKDNREKQQKEMMKLYKEHGFNPVAGCLPMLIPMPMLIALFFVFQNTIELRGVPFFWIPDLSLADPLYILPVLMGVSMFLLQYVSFRSMDTPNPQMKIMMWVMPLFLLFIFRTFPAGLNLYYATANFATIPQQYWIAQERKKAKDGGPVAKSGPPKRERGRDKGGPRTARRWDTGSR